MRVITTLMLSAVLIGCAPMPSMDELQAEALASGDWSRVEKRERFLAKYRTDEHECPAGTTSFCIRRAAVMKCECVSRSAVSRILEGSAIF